MFKKSLPLALIALAGCVALVPPGLKVDTAASPKSDVSGNPSGTSNTSASPAQSQTPVPSASASAGVTPTPTATPIPTPTPTPTPVPKSILQMQFDTRDISSPGVERVSFKNSGVLINADGGMGNKGKIASIAQTASGDMYIQVSIPTDSVSVLCPTCDIINLSNFHSSYGVFKKTKIADEFEFVAMAKKEVLGANYSPDAGKIRYAYNARDFSLSGFAEAASLSVTPLVKSVDVAKKEIIFDTSVWPTNTGNLVLSDVASGDFFGQDDNNGSNNGYYQECPDAGCENNRALAVVRERMAFTGTTAYFVGRGGIQPGDDMSLLWYASRNTTIFRIRENGLKEAVGKSVTDFIVNAKARKPTDSYPYNYPNSYVVYNFTYSQADGKFYIFMEYPGFSTGLYRVSEDALVP